MLMLILNEIFTWVIIMVIGNLLSLFFFPPNPEVASHFSNLDLTILSIAISTIYVFTVPLVFSIFANEFFNISKKKIWFINAPALFIFLFIILSGLILLFLGHFLDVTPKYYRYIFYLVESAIAYFIVYFFAREKR